MKYEGKQSIKSRESAALHLMKQRQIKSIDSYFFSSTRSPF